MKKINNKDLLNAIDELDPKYVTAAWENTQPPEQRTMRLGDKSSPKRIVGRVVSACAGAVVAATLVLFAVKLIPGGISISTNDSLTASENSNNTTPSDNESSSGVLESDSTHKLYGPDGQWFEYDENDEHTNVTTNGGTTTITFDNFIYAGEPRNNYNIFTDPCFFTDKAPNSAMIKLYEQKVPFERRYVGEKVNSVLTVRTAKTVFVKDENGTRLESMTAEFDGIAYMYTIIFGGDDGYYAVAMDSDTTAIPIMTSLYGDESGYDSAEIFTPISIDTKPRVMSYTDHIVKLENPNGLDIDGITGKKGYAVVKMELTDVRATYSRNWIEQKPADMTTASVIEIAEPGDNFNGLGYERTNDALTTIENYLKAHLANMDVKIKSAAEITGKNDTAKKRLDVNAVSSLQYKSPNPEYAELIHDYEIDFFDRDFKYWCRLVYDENSDIWTVIASCPDRYQMVVFDAETFTDNLTAMPRGISPRDFYCLSS